MRTRVRNGSQDEERENAPPPVPHYTWRTFHCIGKEVYLESPQWRPGDRGTAILQAESPLQNVDYYLAQHPEIAFVFYKDYERHPPADGSLIMSKDGVFRPPVPWGESLYLVSEYIISAVEALEHGVPGFAGLFPDFNPERAIRAPYLFLYYSMPFLKDIEPKLTPLAKDLLQQLSKGVIEAYGEEYVKSKRLFRRSLTSRRLLKYLIKPGDVLVRTRDRIPSAYIATSWAVPNEEDKSSAPDWDDRRAHKMSKDYSSQEPRKKVYSWRIKFWYWAFDGAFESQTAENTIRLRTGDVDKEVDIDSLDYYPIQYGTKELQALLERRGRTFWNCRFKNFISYQEDDHGALSSVSQGSSN